MAKFIEAPQKVYIEKTIELAKSDLTGLIETSEKRYRRQIDAAAQAILHAKSNVVFLTGPSSSGKTTSSIFLEQELKKFGKETIRISLDNFYRDREDLPCWSDGTRNFECIEGLDLDFFAERVNALLADGDAKMPRFDFKEGKRSEKTFEVHYGDDTIIIFEGIHALNPDLYGRVSIDGITKIYVSVHSDYVDNAGKKYIKAQDIRLCRRMIRDYLHRGTEPNFTLELWGKVCLGEKEYIRPYRTNSDISINSMHDYEIFVYRDYMIDYSKSFPDNEEIFKLVGKLEKLPSLYERIIPKTSMLREFLPYE